MQTSCRQPGHDTTLPSRSVQLRSTCKYLVREPVQALRQQGLRAHERVHLPQAGVPCAVHGRPLLIRRAQHHRIAQRACQASNPTLLRNGPDKLLHQPDAHVRASMETLPLVWIGSGFRVHLAQRCATLHAGAVPSTNPVMRDGQAHTTRHRTSKQPPCGLRPCSSAWRSRTASTMSTAGSASGPPQGPSAGISRVYALPLGF